MQGSFVYKQQVRWHAVVRTSSFDKKSVGKPPAQIEFRRSTQPNKTGRLRRYWALPIWLVSKMADATRPLIQSIFNGPGYTCCHFDIAQSKLGCCHNSQTSAQTTQAISGFEQIKSNHDSIRREFLSRRDSNKKDISWERRTGNSRAEPQE